MGAPAPGLGVEPGAAGIDIPDDVLDWAEANGVNPDDPDVYILVTTEPHPGWIAGARAALEGEVSAGSAARIEEVRAQDEALTRERWADRQGDWPV
jgi:hypothetical protein